jgi:hypothetical protein
MWLMSYDATVPQRDGEWPIRVIYGLREQHQHLGLGVGHVRGHDARLGHLPVVCGLHLVCVLHQQSALRLGAPLAVVRGRHGRGGQQGLHQWQRGLDFLHDVVPRPERHQPRDGHLAGGERHAGVVCRLLSERCGGQVRHWLLGRRGRVCQWQHVLPGHHRGWL